MPISFSEQLRKKVTAIAYRSKMTSTLDSWKAGGIPEIAKRVTSIMHVLTIMKTKVAEGRGVLPVHNADIRE